MINIVIAIIFLIAFICFLLAFCFGDEIKKKVKGGAFIRRVIDNNDNKFIEYNTYNCITVNDDYIEDINIAIQKAIKYIYKVIYIVINYINDLPKDYKFNLNEFVDCSEIINQATEKCISNYKDIIYDLYINLNKFISPHFESNEPSIKQLYNIDKQRLNNINDPFKKVIIINMNNNAANLKNSLRKWYETSMFSSVLNNTTGNTLLNDGNKFSYDIDIIDENIYTNNIKQENVELTNNKNYDKLNYKLGDSNDIQILREQYDNVYKYYKNYFNKNVIVDNNGNIINININDDNIYNILKTSLMNFIIMLEKFNQDEYIKLITNLNKSITDLNIPIENEDATNILKKNNKEK